MSEQAARQPPAPLDPVERVADIALAIPGVAGLSSGPFGDLKTYLPGRRLDGIRQRQGHTEIGIVLEWGASATSTARLLRARVEGAVGGVVDITVADVTLPDHLAGEPADDSIGVATR